MPESPRSAHGQRTWRQQAPAAPTGGGGAKMLRRIVFSLLGLGLTGLLVWLILWWFFLPMTYFACLPIIDYDPLTVPPIPFSHEDMAAFAENAPPQRMVDLGGLQTYEAINTLSKPLQGLTLRAKDVLILSISAHGVSDAGVAYLLPSDYLRNPNSIDSGRYELRKLLHQICDRSAGANPAGVKLLILDANHLAYDPWLSMVVNEFPRLLEEEVKKLDDPTLWVLSAAGPIQLSQISTVAKRSIFSEAVTEGLRGEADSNGNGEVDLGELFHYVQQKVPKKAAQITPEPQTPRLLHVGPGRADPIALARVAGRKTPKNSQEKENPSPDKSKTAANSPTSPEKQITPERTALKKLLEDAWALRDRLQDRSRNDGWSPIDYAPHLWREFQSLLLGYERLLRSGSAFDTKTKTFADELRQEIKVWDKDVKTAEELSDPEKRLVLGRLTWARLEFRQNAAKIRLDQQDERTVGFKKALQLKNDLVFWAPYYVRWHEAAAKLSEQKSPLYEPLGGLLEYLKASCKALEDRQAASNASGSTAGDQDLKSAFDEFVKLRDILEAEAKNRIDASKKSSPLPTAVASVDALLITPLLPANLRTPLLDIREKLESALPPLDAAAEEPDMAGEKSPAVPNWLWQRLAEQAKLERKLVLLADSNQEITLPKEISPVDTPQSEDQIWSDYRLLGKQLGEFYAGLPRRINEGLNSSDQPSLRKIERLLRILDARDAKLIGDIAKAVACAVPVLPPPAPRPPLVNRPASLELPRDEWLTFEVSVTSFSPPSATANITLKFDDVQLEIRNGENGPPITVDKPLPITFDQDSTKKLKLQARAKSRDEFKPTKVEIKVDVDDQIGSVVMDVRLAPPDVVDLAVFEVGRPIEQPSPSDHHLLLRPFPNRTTNYAMALVNRSGRARKVSVEMFALPEDREIKESPLDTLGNPKTGVKSLAGPVEVSLPADDSRKPIIFPESKAAAGEKEKPKEPEKPKSDKPGDQKPEDKTKPAMSVTHGMYCVIRDPETKKQRGGKWIDFSPCHPRTYLEPKVSYDAAKGQISIHITTFADQLPPLTEKPIDIAWTDEDDSWPKVPGIYSANIATPGQSVDLYAKVEPAVNKKIWIRLKADGYPRAFLYHIDCSQEQRDISRERSLARARIAKPADGQAYKAPLEEILLELQVDAPEGSFMDTADAVQVTIAAEDQAQEEARPQKIFHSDRQVKVFLNDFASSGELKISTAVGDFNDRLNVTGLYDIRAKIKSQISLARPPASSPDNLLEDSKTVILQGSKPELSEIDATNAPVPQGRRIVASVTVKKNLSDIKEMQFGIAKDRLKGLEESDKPVKITQAVAGKWQATLKTDGLEPGIYDLIAKATDVLDFTAEAPRKTITIAPPSTTGPQAPPKTSTIAGRVLLQDGRPLPRIRITLQGTNFSAISDNSGEFTIKNVPHGNYKIEARGTAIGREVSSMQEVVLPGASEPAKVEMRIEW